MTDFPEFLYTIYPAISAGTTNVETVTNIMQSNGLNMIFPFSSDELYAITILTKYYKNKKLQKDLINRKYKKLRDVTSDGHDLLEGFKPGVGNTVYYPVGITFYSGMVLGVNDDRDSNVLVEPVNHFIIHAVNNLFLLDAETTLIPDI